MKKLVLLVFASLFCASSAFAMPWSWNLGATDFVAFGPSPPVYDLGDTVKFTNSVGAGSVTGTLSYITQSLGDDGILGNGDAFSEFGALNVLDSDGVVMQFLDRSDLPVFNFRNAYVEFKGLTGYITNYDNGAGGDTTIANLNNLADDKFDLIFNPGVGTIKFYLDNDFDSTNAGTLELASLTLLAGKGTSPELVLNSVEGQFDLIAGFTSVLPGFWKMGDGTAFEDWMTAYGIPSIFATSFNLGATLRSLSHDGTDIKLGVYNKGDFELSAVPEPSTFLLLGAGLMGLGFIARRRKQ